MIIIPAIDIIDGKCVRLIQGDYKQKTIYSESPLDVAKQFESAGIQRLHLVDLDGAKARKVVNWKTLEMIATNTKLEIDFGGGVTDKADVQRIFDAGSKYVTVGSIAVKNEASLKEWIQEFGPSSFILGADVRDEMIAIHGWTQNTTISIFDFIKKWMQLGITQIFCTDINKDGKLAGPSLNLYEDIINRFPSLFFIASGGVSSYNDLSDLKRIGCSGAIVGKAIYEGKIELGELKKLEAHAS